MPSHNCVARQATKFRANGLRLCFFSLICLLAVLLAPSFGQTESNDTKPADSSPQRAANRLVDETSPYLLQHAYNPVNWHPWSEEALEKAKRENKPIFLSIGYSSCHWCHVMEHESFEDEEIAALLNKNFICIKVDREERPDVDSIYMTSVQIISRRGGWPLSVFLTPDTKPFFGGTYFPARDGDRPGSPGFVTVLSRVLDAWNQRPNEVQKTADSVSKLIQQVLEGEDKPERLELESAILDRAISEFEKQFDPTWGGFGFSETNSLVPKFPQGATLMFLAQLAADENPSANRFLTTTLDRIAQGGIRDHVGGGFHRYSVDRFWHIPHFEKMLYDNALLASVYATAFEATKNPVYENVLREMLTFLKREMTAPGGGFFAALDADSEGEEGKFYRWDREEWRSFLTAEQASLFESVYVSQATPNFEGKHFVPLRRSSWQELAKAAGTKPAELRRRMAEMNRLLLNARSNRSRPLTDKKIVTAWNGLMIRGLADAGRILKDDSFVEAAKNAANFILAQSRSADGRLFRTHTAGKARLNAYLDDYAFLTNGLLALHRATGDERWLGEARGLMAIQDQLFLDADGGGYFFTSRDHEQLIVRGKQLGDGALPSGNSVAAWNLLYVSRVTGDASLREKAETTIQAAADVIRSAPASVPSACAVIHELLQSQ